MRAPFNAAGQFPPRRLGVRLAAAAGHDRFFWRSLALNYRIYVRAKRPLACKYVGLRSFWGAGIVRQGSVGAFLRTVWHIFREGGRASLGAWRAGRELLPGVWYHFGRGPEPRRILASAHRLPRPDLSAGDLATMGILRDLAGLGYDVVLLPEDFTATEPFCRAVREMASRWWRAGRLRQSRGVRRLRGPSFAAFYCIRLQVAEAFVPGLRAVSPRARVIFHAPDLAWLREERQPGCGRRREARAQFAAMRAADAVVVVSPVEKPWWPRRSPRPRSSCFRRSTPRCRGMCRASPNGGHFFPRRFRPCPECRRGALVRPGRLAATPRDCPRPVSASQGRRCRRKR